MDNVSLTIDDLSVVANKESTILRAALQNGIYIPHLCFHSDLNPSGVCRLCMVEVEGQVNFSCLTSVKEGMVIKTRTPMIDKVRRTNIEIIVANHHVTCRGCSASGHCELQKIMAYIRIDRKRVRRLRLPNEELPKNNSNPFFYYDPNKCVFCEICVRTCHKIQEALNIVGRGYNSKIAFWGDSSICESCMECVVRCPVGALMKNKQIFQENIV